MSKPAKERHIVYRIWWLSRWHVARAMVHVALGIAPKGAARDRLIAHIEAFANEVYTAIRSRP